jgi:hypothetical protein
MHWTKCALLAALGAAFALLAWPNGSPPPLQLACASPHRAEPLGGSGEPTAPLARCVVAADELRQPIQEAEPTNHDPIQPPADEPIVARDDGLRCELVVLDGGTGQPIVGYGVRCTPHAEVRPTGSAGAFDAFAYALRARSTHRGGVAELRGLQPGRNLLLVEPDDRVTFAPMAPVVFEVGETYAARQVVSVPRAGHRTLVVVRRDGTPVAGSLVELLLPLEPGAAADVTFETSALTPRQCFERGVLPPAMLVQRVVTDATGSARLRGAQDQRHVLRVLGPGHMPTRIQDLQLDDSLLRLEVADGSSLRGHLESTAELQGMPELQAERFASYRPGLQLVDVHDAGRRVPARRTDSLKLAEDGSFCIEGIAPGSWHVLRTRWVVEPDGRETMTTEWLATVRDVRAGEARVVAFGPERMPRGRIEGTLFDGHEPWANARVVWEADRLDGIPGLQPAIATLCTDEQGRFRVELAPGSWHAAVAEEVSAGQWHKVRLAGRFEVQPGGTLGVELRPVAAVRQVQ